VNQMMIEKTDEVYRIACQEVRGGNHLAAYSAELPGLSGWVSCHPLQPSRRGGDVYYMSACSMGVMARVVLADISGHGETVSVAAGHLRDTLSHHLERWDQSTLIRELNDSFLKRSRSTRFATAFVASFYRDSGELLFTNAGHMPPLWYRATVREWSLLSDSTPLSKEIVDLPLGLVAGTSYTQTAIQLEPEDLLLLYTDGISEAYDESGTQLGLERLLSIARHLPTESAVAAGKGLIAAVDQFRGAAPSVDDATVLALQRRVRM
jgi:sigma-B regulation protein RsbU (phosphoserine phosphatase)